MKNYLCKENQTEFVMAASSRKKAEEFATIYNAVVIKEIKPKSLKDKPKKLA